MNVRLYLTILWLLSPGVYADEPFYTGMWEYAIEIKVPGMPQSDLKKVQKCIREINDVIALFKPDPSCSVSHVELTDSELQWRLYCKTSGGTYHGQGHLEGDRRTQQGRVQLETVIPGMKNILSTSYVISGKNYGVCQ